MSPKASTVNGGICIPKKQLQAGVSNFISSQHWFLDFRLFPLFACAVPLEPDLFRYEPAIYLEDAHLKHSLSQITTASNMISFLQNYFKPDEEEPRKGATKRQRTASVEVQNRTRGQSSLPLANGNSKAKNKHLVSSPKMQLKKKRADRGATPSNTTTLPPATDKNEGNSTEHHPPRATLASTPAMVFAAEAGNLARLKQIISNGQDVNATLRSPDGDKSGETALMRAAQRGRVDCVQELVRNGANVGTKGPNATTALHEAAAGGHANCMEVLMNAGADVSVKNKDGKSAIDVANDWVAALPDPQKMQKALKEKVDSLMALLQTEEPAPKSRNLRGRATKSSTPAVQPAPPVDDGAPTATPITADLPQLKENREALEAVERALAGEPLDTIETYHLLVNAEALQLPVSNGAPVVPQGKNFNFVEINVVWPLFLACAKAVLMLVFFK